MNIIPSTSELGVLIRERRRKQGVTQLQLAAVSGVGIRFISELEHGKGTCQIEKVISVLKTLGLRLILATHAEKIT